jgi:hypothetical protein
MYSGFIVVETLLEPKEFLLMLYEMMFPKGILIPLLQTNVLFKSGPFELLLFRELKPSLKKLFVSL